LRKFCCNGTWFFWFTLFHYLSFFFTPPGQRLYITYCRIFLLRVYIILYAMQFVYRYSRAHRTVDELLLSSARQNDITSYTAHRNNIGRHTFYSL
jgi:hypothetical protein